MTDWTTLGEETVENLRRYLMIDTTNPPGNEAAGAFLAEREAHHQLPPTPGSGTGPWRTSWRSRSRDRSGP